MINTQAHRTRRAGWRPRLLLTTACCVLLSACRVDGLVFQQDRRVVIEEPRYRAQVLTPVRVAWSVSEELRSALEDPDEPPDRFALLVDVDPQPPGEALAYFARDDPSCRPADGCPNEEYLATLGVFVTTGTEYVFGRLPPAPGVDVGRGERDLHDVTIVLLDNAGRRLGESAWTATFEIIRPDSQGARS